MDDLNYTKQGHRIKLDKGQQKFMYSTGTPSIYRKGSKANWNERYKWAFVKNAVGVKQYVQKQQQEYEKH